MPGRFVNGIFFTVGGPLGKRRQFPGSGLPGTQGLDLNEPDVYRDLGIVNGAPRHYTRANPFTRRLEQGEE